MIEKVVENWLTKTTERSFGRAFCYLLMSEGHTIIHLTKHNPMEKGKDVISLSPMGEVCAYQLKTAKNGTVSLSQWREDVENQIYELTEIPVEHPSVDSTKTHKPYFVTNGDLDEKVQNVIHLLNDRFVSRGLSDLKLNTMVRGELLEKAKKAGDTLLPDELRDFKKLFELLLEIYLSDGRGPLPKEKYINLLEMLIPINKNKDDLSSSELSRILSSAAFVVAIVTSNFTEVQNFASEIEAWTIYISYLIAVAEKFELAEKYWKDELEVAESIVYESLDGLAEEIITRDHFLEGNVIIDKRILGFRMTLLVGLMCTYIFVSKKRGDSNVGKIGKIADFILKENPKMVFWGESAGPYYLSLYWHLKDSNPLEAKILLRKILNTIILRNTPRSEDPLPNAYYLLDQLIPYIYGTAEKPLLDKFAGQSSLIKILLFLVVKEGDREYVAAIWKEMSKIANRTFEADYKWEDFIWRAKEGVDMSNFPEVEQSWSELVREVLESQEEPPSYILKNKPELALLLYSVFPFRLNDKKAMWLDRMLSSS